MIENVGEKVQLKIYSMHSKKTDTMSNTFINGTTILDIEILYNVANGKGLKALVKVQ